MINITNIVLASALVMAASGEASAQTTVAPQAEPTGSQPRVAGRGTDAGSLEAGIAALKRMDWEAALLLLKPLAEQGNPDAQNRIGFMYLYGVGVPQDWSEAMKWYHKAADQGYAEAQNSLGGAYSYTDGRYRTGQPVSPDYAEAMKWYHKAADQGNAGGQFGLGYMYENGQGVGAPRDYAEAMKWYRKAADQGFPRAQSSLGVMYENGEGVPKDYAEAIKWYRKAAEHGDAFAQKIVTRLNEQSEQDNEQSKQDKITKTMLEAKKEIGDTVCHPPCTASFCIIYGQVENVHNDKIEVRQHLSDHDKLTWISYNEVVECH